MDNLEKQNKVNSLNQEYETYIKGLQREWRLENKFPESRDVYEVAMTDPSYRRQVEEYNAKWSAYITPIAEAWWKERGYGIKWPDDDSKPSQVYELENA